MTTTVSDGSTLQDRVIVLTSAEDSAGEVFRFEYVARQVTPPLRDHVHTEQEERLEVLEGTVRCRVAGIDRLLQRGQGVIIPPRHPARGVERRSARLAVDRRVPASDERRAHIQAVYRRCRLNAVGLQVNISRAITRPRTLLLDPP